MANLTVSALIGQLSASGLYDAADLLQELEQSQTSSEVIQALDRYDSRQLSRGETMSEV